jgi:hypothetical protein
MPKEDPSGHLESVEWPRRGSGRYPGEQAEMSEDLGDHRGFFDGGDDLQGAAALGTLLHKDRMECPLGTAKCRGYFETSLTPFKRRLRCILGVL